MAVPDTVYDLLRDRGSRIALVGASTVAHKYGSIIVLDLVDRGYTVVPISRSRDTVHGLTAYPSLGDAPWPIDIINVVVPPWAALPMVRATDPAICEVIWFQPGSFDATVLTAARERFPTVIAGDCIMVVARQV